MLRTDAARLVHRNGWWLLLAGVPLAAFPLVLAVAAVTDTAAAVGAVPAMGLLVAGSIWSILKRNPSPRLEEGSLEVDERGAIDFGGRRIAEPGDVEAGFVVPGDDGPLVLLRRGGARLPLVISVPDVEAGREILRALGLDASQSVAETRTISPMFATPGRLAAVAFGVPLAFFVIMQALFLGLDGGGTRVVGFGLTMLAMLAATASSVAALAPRKVSVGIDGVLVRWMGRREFIPFDRIRAVRRYEGSGWWNDLVGVEIEKDDGVTLRLPAGRKLERADAALLAERIEQARQAFASRRSSAVAHELGQGTSDPAGWLQRLRGLGAGANADMRTAPVADLELARVLEDPSLDDGERVGAALALSAGRGPEQRERVRVVARTVAAPRLRVALEKVAAASTEDEYAEALASVEAEETAPARLARK